MTAEGRYYGYSEVDYTEVTLFTHISLAGIGLEEGHLLERILVLGWMDHVIDENIPLRKILSLKVAGIYIYVVDGSQKITRRLGQRHNRSIDYSNERISIKDSVFAKYLDKNNQYFYIL